MATLLKQPPHYYEHFALEQSEQQFQMTPSCQSYIMLERNIENPLISYNSNYYVIPENIHTSPTEGIISKTPHPTGNSK